MGGEAVRDLPTGECISRWTMVVMVVVVVVVVQVHDPLEVISQVVKSEKNG